MLGACSCMSALPLPLASPMAQALTRVKKNSAYFRVNYLLVMLGTCAATFALHPTALIVLGVLLAGWVWCLFVKTAPIVIGGRSLSDRETLIGMSAISFITIFFLTRYVFCVRMGMRVKGMGRRNRGAWVHGRMVAPLHISQYSS